MTKRERIRPIGFSSYEVVFTDKGLEVYGVKKKLKALKNPHHNVENYYLKHDSGVWRHIPAPRLAYAVKNGLDYMQLDKGVRISGSVNDMHIGKCVIPEKRKKELARERLEGFEQTLKCIKLAMLKNDFTGILMHARKHRRGIVGTFYRLNSERVTYEGAAQIFDEAIDLVMDRARECRVRKVPKMDAMFLSAMQTIMMNGLKMEEYVEY